jgi:hypothetical protein
MQRTKQQRAGFNGIIQAKLIASWEGWFTPAQKFISTQR